MPPTAKGMQSYKVCVHVRVRLTMCCREKKREEEENGAKILIIGENRKDILCSKQPCDFFLQFEIILQ